MKNNNERNGNESNNNNADALKKSQSDDGEQSDHGDHGMHTAQAGDPSQGGIYNICLLYETNLPQLCVSLCVCVFGLCVQIFQSKCNQTMKMRQRGPRSHRLMSCLLHMRISSI